MRTAHPLVLRLRNWVGDVTLGVPALQRLADAGYDLTLVGKGWARDLLAGHGWPMHVLPATWRERVSLLRRLRAEAKAADPGFDRRLNAVCYPYSFSSALEFRLAGLAVDEVEARVGRTTAEQLGVDQVEHDLAEVAGVVNTPFVEHVLCQHAVLLHGILADRLAKLLASDMAFFIRILIRNHAADAQLLLGEPECFKHKEVCVAMITAVTPQQLRQWMILI